MKTSLKKKNYSDKEMQQLTEQFTPLVKALAKRYEGRGAEYEDLVQEGYLALIKLAPRCTSSRVLPLFLKRQLPAKVRNAARRLRKRETIDLDQLIDAGMEPGSEMQLPGMADSIFDLMEGDERDILKMLAFGYLQKEIARKLGITQQAVSSRIGKIRTKTRNRTE